jgi:two-component system, LuxR family, response regulator FixJ
MSAKGLVHIIDDDEAVRDSLAFLLDSSGIEAKSYESAAAYLDAAARGASGCIVTDVRMPGMSGIDLLRKLKADGVLVPVIVMTGHGDVPLAVEAMKLGAFDFVEKPFDDDALLTSVRAALGEGARHSLQEVERQQIDARLALLSARERQVLDGLIAGQANKVIAYELGISPRTVEIYRANVMTKMQANSLSELVRMALLTGALRSTS